jgi:hypothetical protein
MLLNIHSLPRIANPHIANRPRSLVPALHDILRQRSLLRLILVVQDKYAESRLLTLPTRLFLCLDDVLFEFAHGVLKRCPGVVDLVNDEDVLADEVGHFERGEVQPLCAGYFCTGLFDGVGAEGFVEGEADGLDGDVG